MSRTSAGIWGRDSLRGPPQAEQDMEVGVFCRVHLRHAQIRLRSSASPGNVLSCCLDGSVPVDVLRGPEQLLERRGRGRCSEELRRRSGEPVKPQREQAGLWGELASVQRGQDQRASSLLVPGHIHRLSGVCRGASQIEQRGAPAAFRKVQQPQAHWLLCMGIEPEEKLDQNTTTHSIRYVNDGCCGYSRTWRSLDLSETSGRQSLGISCVQMY